MARSELTELSQCSARTSKRGEVIVLASGKGVVVNMARSRAEAERVARRLSHVSQRFLGLSVEYLGHVATDRHAPLAVRQRTPVVIRYPHCAASACISEISRRTLSPATDVTTPSGVWARVASLFL